MSQTGEIDLNTRPQDARSGMLSAGLALVVVGTCLAVIPSNSWPYVDGKLLVLVLGTLLVWAARPPADRGLVLVAGLWIGSLVLATVFGVDRWQSLAGQEGLGGGLILLVPCAVLLVGGAGLPPWARNRIPKWIAVTSVVVGATAISHHFWPNLLVKFFPYDTVSTSPMGHPIKLAALMGIAIVACVAWKPKIPAVGYAAVVVVTTALAFSTKRGGVIAALVGLGVLYWKTPDSRKRVLVVFGIFAVVFSGLTVADKVLPGVSLSSGSRFADVASEDSTKSRLLAQPALVGAFIDRPLTGWGPANTWGGYLSNASTDPANLGERGWIDAHDIVMEQAVTGGIVALVTFLVMLVAAVRRMIHAPRSLGWAAALAAGLFSYHLLQPMSPSLTPLMFLVAGIACGRAPDEAASRWASPREGRGWGWAPGVALSAFVILALAIVGSSSLDWYGHTYNSETSLAMSHDLAPWRLQPADHLATYYALDWRSQHPYRGPQAAALASSMVSEHPWDPSSRLLAADIFVLLNQPDAARKLVLEQLQRFPSDRSRFSALADQVFHLSPGPSSEPSTSQSPSSAPSSPRPQSPTLGP